MLSRRDDAWLARALKEAARASGRSRHGCVIVKGGRVLAVATNKFTNTIEAVSAEHIALCSVHAEIAALRRVSDPVGATAYVARVGAAGTPLSSAPCPACAAALAAAGVRRVVFT